MTLIQYVVGTILYFKKMFFFKFQALFELKEEIRL